MYVSLSVLLAPRGSSKGTCLGRLIIDSLAVGIGKIGLSASGLGSFSVSLSGFVSSLMRGVGDLLSGSLGGGFGVVRLGSSSL